MTVRIDVLLEAIPEPAFVCNDASLLILAVNQQAIDRYGYSRVEFQNMRLSDLSPVEQAERLKKRLAAAGAGARVRESSVHRLANGENINVDMSLCALEHEGEHLTLVLVRKGAPAGDTDAQARLLEASLERLNDMVIITEAETIDKPGPKIVYVNNAFVRRTGYSREEVLGDTPRLLQGAKTQRKELDRIRKALEQKRTVRAELINYTKSGEEFWLEIEISPVTNSAGKVTHFVAVERDVTGRVTATRALAESRARFSAVAEATADIIWDLDLKDNNVWWSRSYSTVFGYPLLEAEADVQTSWLRRIHEDDRQRVADSMKHAIDTQQKQWHETYRFIHNDGHEVPVAHRGSVISDQDKRPVRFAGGLVVLNEEDKADPRLQKMAWRLSKQVEIIQKMGGASAETDKKLYQLIASSAQSLLDGDGSALSLLQGDHFTYVATLGVGGARRSTMAPTKNPIAEGVLEKAQTRILNDVSKETQWDAEAWRESGVQSAIITVLSGSTRPLAVLKVLSKKANAFSDEDLQSLELFAQSASVVLERRQLEAQLRNSQRLQSLGQLTGGIAHDFNNLLTVILGSADTLVSRFQDDPEICQIADLTKAAAERGAALTNRLLAFARQQPLDPKTTDVNKLVAGMDAIIGRTLGSNIEVEVIRGAGLWEALIDPAQLESAILNLCINARDAMPKGGKLTIELANTHLSEEYADREDEVLPGQYVMVAVSDTGVGMPPDIRTRVFDPFFTTKAPGRGSGLGLSMVFGFIKQSRGHVKIYSEQDQGTTVRLYMPRATPYASADTAPDRSTQRRRNIKVLLVEDDDLVRGHIISQLRALGYQVVEARNGHEALEAVRQIADFDLLFTDVVMPGGMSGKEVASAVLTLRPGMKVLFTSGYTQNAIVHGGKLDMGVNFISKPFRQVELERKINHVLISEEKKDD